MNYNFEVLSQTRENIVKILKNNDAEILNKIPANFNNNIVWNAAHCIVTSQILCYKLSGLPLKVEDDLIKCYSKGSKVEESCCDTKVDWICDLLISTKNQLITDYNNSLFKEYSEYPTSYGVTLKNIDDAIAFNNVHEGLHLGYMMAQLRTLKNKSI